MAHGIATATASRAAAGLRALPGAIAALVLAASAALAAPTVYTLEGRDSRVGFITYFGEDEVTGRFPVTAARLELDFSDVTNTSVSVTLDARAGVASYPFAAQALKGPDMLDTYNYPTIAFQSTEVARDGNGAQVQGDLTIRGVTRRVALKAVLLRKKDADPDDLSNLFIRLTGAIDRHDFGVSGWQGTVSDEVRLDILAAVSRAEDQ